MTIEPIVVRGSVGGAPTQMSIGRDQLVNVLSQLASQLPEAKRVGILALIEALLLEE